MSDTKKCISCGANLSVKAIFCPSCGTRQEEIKKPVQVSTPGQTKQEEIKINKIQRKPKVKIDINDDILKDIEKKSMEVTIPLQQEKPKKIEKEPEVPKKYIKKETIEEKKQIQPIEKVIKEPKKEKVEEIKTIPEPTNEIPVVKEEIKKEKPVEEKKEEKSISTIIETDDILLEDHLMLGIDDNVEIIEAPIKEEPVSKAAVKADKLTPRLQIDEKEIFKYAQNKLKEISISEEMEMTLYPIIGKGTRGFRCTFLGATGTPKEDKFEELAKLLYDIGKIDDPNCKYIGFGDIPDKWDTRSMYVVDDLQSAISYLFNLEDFSENASDMQKHYQDLMGQLINAPRNAYIFLTSKPAEYKGFVPLDPRLTFVFDKVIEFPDLTNEEIFEKFKILIPDTHIKQINKSFEKDFIGYIDRNRRFFPFENAELATFLANYAVRENDIRLPKEKYNPNTVEETLSKIIGMENVKDQVRELNQYLSIRKNLEKAGAKLPDFNMHMMFLGNPGVGKTSIARVISKILFDLGYCREEKLVEVTSKDLVGAYGNQTGIKTNRVIMRALGGVLFVDEAYSLSNSCGQAGAEAIAIIIKAMMDYKDDLVVMFAGYNLEMRTFVESNSGISSRINYIFKFEDYSPEELFDIFKLKLGFTGMKLADDAIVPVQKLCKFASGRKNAGNGRFVENLIQKALTKHALLDLPPDKIMTIGKESIPSVEDIMKTVF